MNLQPLYHGVTQISNWPAGPTTASSYYDDLRPTDTCSWVSNYDPDYTYTPKKQETAKEKKIRQAAAFSSFYKSGGYSPRKSVKTIRAEQRERSERESKFKSLNNNLIL